MGEAGHSGVAVTIHRLRDYCLWSTMEADVTGFIQQCLNCINSKAGERVPSPYGDT
ncbi:unnamed protein product, partial [Discosporangium mesarthrocarpum]